jgi:hypothetical protein
MHGSLLLNRSETYGIVGGYGATGSMVVSELFKKSTAQILIGGRDLEKGNALATKFESRVSAVHLDVLDARSLDEFCRQCSTVVNCAGPVMVLQDRAAQAALRGHCHYIDAAGLSLVRERLLPHQRELEDLGLSFVVSAGWMPGLTELVPAYADVAAKARMETIESLTVYFADCGEWSDNALRDGVWYIRERGLRNPGCFHKGRWTRAKPSTAFRKVNLGDGIAAGRFCLVSMSEIEELAHRFQEYDFSAYTYLSGTGAALTATLMALVPLPEKFGVRLLRHVFRSNRLPVGGFVVVKVLGQTRGLRQAFTVQITFEHGRDYWLHGVALATAARLASSRRARAGVHFLADAVDPVGFVGELRQAGVHFNDNIAPCVEKTKTPAD